MNQGKRGRERKEGRVSPRWLCKTSQKIYKEYEKKENGARTEQVRPDSEQDRDRVVPVGGNDERDADAQSRKDSGHDSERGGKLLGDQRHGPESEAHQRRDPQDGEKAPRDAPAAPQGRQRVPGLEGETADEKYEDHSQLLEEEDVSEDLDVHHLLSRVGPGEGDHDHDEEGEGEEVVDDEFPVLEVWEGGV